MSNQRDAGGHLSRLQNSEQTTWSRNGQKKKKAEPPFEEDQLPVNPPSGYTEKEQVKVADMNCHRSPQLGKEEATLHPVRRGER